MPAVSVDQVTASQTAHHEVGNTVTAEGGFFTVDEDTNRFQALDRPQLVVAIGADNKQRAIFGDVRSVIRSAMHCNRCHPAVVACRRREMTPRPWLLAKVTSRPEVSRLVRFTKKSSSAS